MKVLVTGATGFLGLHLCRRLAHDGWDVTALHRPTSDVAALSALEVRRTTGDVTDAAAIGRAVTGQDLVIHAAAHLAYWRGYRETQRLVNLEGTRIVAAACRSAGVGRLVQVSSVAAIGIPGPGDAPADETFRFNLQSSGLGYHLSKWEAEGVVHDEVNQGLDAVIVNPGTIFGPAPRGYRGGEMIEKVRGRRAVPSFVGGINAVHVEDVVDGIVRASARGRRGERYILGGENLSYRRIVDESAAELGQRTSAVPVPPLVTRLASLVFEPLGAMNGRRPRFTHDTHYCACRAQFYRSDKAQTELGYTARPFRTTVREYLEWRERRRAVATTLSAIGTRS